MSNLKDLVPPMELCKLIPAGEFVDTAFVRIGNTKIIVLRRSAKWSFANQPHIPAPTLQEIMEELPKDDAYNNLLMEHSLKIGWQVHYPGDRKRHCYDQNPAPAALKLWLKLKGIENE